METLRETRRRIEELEDGLLAIQTIVDDLIEPDCEDIDESE